MSDNQRKTDYDRRGKKKIVLFFPTPAYGHYRIELALAIAVIAAPLEGKYDLHLIDERVTPNYEQEVLKHLDDAVCVGISSITGYQIKRGIDMARKLRAMNPEVPFPGAAIRRFPRQCCGRPPATCLRRPGRRYLPGDRQSAAGKVPKMFRAVPTGRPQAPSSTSRGH